MADINGWLEPMFRWIHVVAGVLWIGLLYFFNFVNGPVQGKLDGDTKKKVNPELLPRALYFFRWGAAYTWITGILLLLLTYYHGKLMVDAEHADKSTTAILVSLAVIFAGVFLYDVAWKSLAKNESVGIAVSFVVVVGLMAMLNYAFNLTARALYIHIGGLFGTTMAFNVWFRIWPAQRKIIAAVKEGKAPDAALPALAGLRSKHNTYMSVPLIFTMVSNHFPTFLGFQGNLGWVLLTIVIALGWLATKTIYNKAATPTPASY